MLEKVQIIMKEMLVEILKVILVRTQKEESWRKSLYSHKQNVGQNVDIKGHSDEVLDRSEEHVIQNWRKDARCYKVTKNLAGLCPGT